MIDLGTFAGGSSSTGNGINGSGLVVGESLSANLTTSSAYIYKDSMFDLGSFGGAYSSANGINARGQVVGYSKTRRSLDHAFLWVPKKPGTTKGHIYDLGTLPGAEARKCSSPTTTPSSTPTAP